MTNKPWDPPQEILDMVTPEIGEKFLELIIDGELRATLMTLELMQSAVPSFMMRKVEHHVGDIDGDDYKAVIANASDDVKGALAHEADHCDSVTDAIEQAVEALRAWIICIEHNHRISQAETN